MRWLLLGFLCFGFTRAEESVGADRITREIDGVAYTFSPADEPLVGELAPLVAAARRKKKEMRASMAAEEPQLFTATDLQANKSEYLRLIAGSLGFETPSPEQVKSYDKFLEMFEKLGAVWDQARKEVQDGPVTLWRKPELVAVLKRGELVPGFKLADDGETVEFHWNLTDQKTEEVAPQEHAQSNATYTYAGMRGGGIETRSASVTLNPIAEDETEERGSTIAPFILPIVVKAGETATQLAETVEEVVESVQSFGVTSLSDVFILFHEAVETGIIDRYLVGEDRRWLCDGVANYVAWRIIRDRAGEQVAREAYDLEAQLDQWEPQRKKINLRRWKVAERQNEQESESALNKAHYAFATRAVFLMVEKHGEDFLPRLFREIGKTPRDKATMRTVEQAYRKLTGQNLSTILKAAVALRPKQPRSTSVTRQSWRRAADLNMFGECGFNDNATVSCGRGV